MVGPVSVVRLQDNEFPFDKEKGTGQPIFGFPIARALQRPGGLSDYDIPPLIVNAMNFIEKNGFLHSNSFIFVERKEKFIFFYYYSALQIEGIFRISAKSGDVDKLKEKYDCSLFLISIFFVWASSLKNFFFGLNWKLCRYLR